MFTVEKCAQLGTNRRLVSGSKAAPHQFAPAAPAGADDVVSRRRRRVQRAAVVRAEDLQRLGSQFRREVDEVILGGAIGKEQGRPGGKGLSGRGDFAGDCRCRNRSFFDGPDRLAGFPIEDEGKALFGDLRHRLDRLAVDHDVDQVRRCRWVVVPYRVVHELKMPGPLAGFGMQGHEGIGEQVVAEAMAAEVVRHRRANGK